MLEGLADRGAQDNERSNREEEQTVSDRIIQDGQVVAVNNQVQQRQVVQGLTGLPTLVEAEAASWRRFLPGKLPWTELQLFEQEVERLEARRRELTPGSRS